MKCDQSCKATIHEQTIDTFLSSELGTETVLESLGWIIKPDMMKRRGKRGHPLECLNQ